VAAYNAATESQSLQIRSVISIDWVRENPDLAKAVVAIPSNQVGNFHPARLRGSSPLPFCVAIPSNQVGNFHPTVDLVMARRQVTSQSLQIRSVISIAAEVINEFFPSGGTSRNPFKSGR